MEQRLFDGELHRTVLATGLRVMVKEGSITFAEAMEHRETMQDTGRIAVTGFADYLKGQLELKGKKPESTLIDRSVEEYINTEGAPNGE